MPSLAGKPPYATDEPDSAYETPARPRLQQRKPAPQEGSRDTTYAAYDHYFNESDESPDRRSGIDAVGQGFMNAFMADDSDSEDEQPVRQFKKSPLSQSAVPASLQPAHKPDEQRPPPAYSLAAPDTKSPPPAVLRPARKVADVLAPVVPPHHRMDTGTPPPARPDVRSPPPLAAPRPSRPTDLSAIQGPTVMSRSPQPGMPVPRPAPIAVPTPVFSPASPTEKFGIPTTPLELNDPMTPITPAFARRPLKPSEPRPISVKFGFQKGSIMRGKDEETPLARNTDKKDDFWKRFSMVMKDNGSIGGKKESEWLSKTKSTGRSMRRIIWVVGLVLLLAIGGGIGLGWYFTHDKPTTSVPVAIGGSANDGIVHSTSSSKKATGTGTGTASATKSGVSATLTLSDRSLPEPTSLFVIPPEPLLGPFDSRANSNDVVAHRRRRRALHNRFA